MENNLNENGIIDGTGTNPQQELIERLAAVSWQIRKDAADRLSKYGDKVIPDLIKSLNSQNDDQRFWALVALSKISTDNAMKPLYKLCKVRDETLKSYATVALGHSSHRDAVPTLILLLNDPDWRVCNGAVNSLVMQGNKVIEPLIQALKSASYNAAFWITKVLSRLGDEGIEVLVTFSRFKSKNIRMLVAEALGESENPRAIKALLNLLKDEHWMVRQSTVDSLIKLGDKVIEYLIFFLKSEKENMLPFVEKVFSGMGEYRIGPLVNLLKHEDREVRILAADALGKTNNSKAVKPLIGALSDKVWLVRKAAAMGLSQIKDLPLEDLVKSLSSGEDNVRFWVAAILGEVGERAIEPLLKMLTAPEKELRFYSAQALGKIRDDRVVINLVNALQDESWTVRNKVSESLIDLGDVSLIPVMKSLMSQNEDRRFWAKKVIEVIGPQELDQILEIISNSRDSELRYFAAYTLSLIGNERCLPYLINASLNDPNEWVRKYSITALSKIKDNRALDVMAKLLFDLDEDVAYWTAKSFTNMGEMAIEKIRTILEAGDPKAKNLAILALGGIGDKQAVTMLIDRLAEKGPEADRCAGILAACGEKAVPYLIDCLGSTRAEMRENASRVLIKIGEPAEDALAEALQSNNQDMKYWSAKVLREIKKLKDRGKTREKNINLKE
ncbi:MAG: HEAT repeat domain-containing protein [Candidatus Wallbacteria bacterium]|nr:HEAT repeat domain-containing protein [Candidatus Wallbacteria bacterium]